MVAFHEVLFPSSIALGATGGPERRTEVVGLANGREERNSPWAASRRRWNAGVAVRSLDDLHVLLVFFEARRGRLHGFRWRDSIDWKSCAPSQTPSPLDQPIGVGDGVAATFPLIKRYADGGSSFDRPIAKPVSGSVRVAVDTVELTLGVDFSVDVTTGVVTLTAPPGVGAAVTAGFAFDTPVRFDTDRLDVSREAFGAGAVPDVPVIEILV
jgi:uncharacterized protein (TIGR02217 family)